MERSSQANALSDQAIMYNGLRYVYLAGPGWLYLNGNTWYKASTPPHGYNADGTQQHAPPLTQPEFDGSPISGFEFSGGLQNDPTIDSMNPNVAENFSTHMVPTSGRGVK